MTIDADGNYVYSPKKFVSLVGVHDLIVVETDDAILITTHDHSQDVGKVVKALAATGREDLV
jgi:mannose-1-phosphate guanylyltransferase